MLNVAIEYRRRKEAYIAFLAHKGLQTRYWYSFALALPGLDALNHAYFPLLAYAAMEFAKIVVCYYAAVYPYCSTKCGCHAKSKGSPRC